MEGVKRKVATLTILKKDEAHTVQQENIKAAGMLSDLIKTCIGPRAMAKMILTRIGGIELTNDGNSILREIEVAHPVIKSLVELSRTQSEEVGDGTTSVVVLAAEILRSMGQLLQEGEHPVVLCAGLKKALEYTLEKMKKHTVEIHTVRKEKQKTEEEVVREVIRQGIGTKMSRYLVDLESIAVKAINTIKRKENNRVQYDIKNNIRIEKVPGGQIEETQVYDGIVIQKDVVDSSMRRRIKNAKILLIDYALEYRKGENQMHIEMHNEDVFSRALEVEEKQIEKIVGYIVQEKPAVVVSEKGICDHAIALLKKHKIVAIRRVKKSDTQRIALATGAQIVSRPEDVSAKCMGCAGVFDIEVIDEEEYCKFVQCAAPKACTVMIRGPSKDIINELERNLHDALCIARNVYTSTGLVRGAGAIEMALAHELEKAQGMTKREMRVFGAVARALQAIPNVLVTNSGSTCVMKRMLELRARHSQDMHAYGVDGETGEICEKEIYESVKVKEQSMKSAIEGAIVILRVDGIVRQE